MSLITIELISKMKIEHLVSTVGINRDISSCMRAFLLHSKINVKQKEKPNNSFTHRSDRPAMHGQCA